MISILQSIMEGFSNLPETDNDYGNGHRCVELMLDRAEKAGMLPPESPSDTYDNYGNDLGMNEWEDEDAV